MKLAQKTFFSRHEKSHEKCSEIFPTCLSLYLVGLKNPAKFPPNFLQNSAPPKKIPKKKSTMSFCRSVGRKNAPPKEHSAQQKRLKRVVVFALKCHCFGSPKTAARSALCLRLLFFVYQPAGAVAAFFGPFLPPVASPFQDHGQGGLSLRGGSLHDGFGGFDGLGGSGEHLALLSLVLPNTA